MITATILTKNNQKTLKDTLDALKPFNEVIILDSGSTDETLNIAKRYPNVTIHTTPFMGFGQMHNYCAKLASHDWIFSVDSDEVPSPTLVEEILSLNLNEESIYTIERQNYLNGKRIRGCAGWYPDVIPRLYHRKKTKFSDDLVHEKIKTNNFKLVRLKNPLHHTPYLEIGDFLEKMQLYSTLYAQQNSSEQTSLLQALFHSWFAFIKSYIFKRGFLAGKEGFIISMYNGHTAFYKYLKLTEQNKP